MSTYGRGGLARCDSPERISLIIATGMNNSSAVAVLAAAWFSYRPEVLLPGVLS
ncbi:MAG TPA: hypothetical protein VGD53_06035 [Actinoallomurus sp.]